MPNLADSDNCTGCTACANICPNHCIEMKKFSDGFSYPAMIDHDRCVECGVCETVCPVVNYSAKDSSIPIAYAALSKDETIRMESSSGGIFTELAQRIIQQNGVVYGAVYDEKYEVHHCCVESIEELYKLRGAKYAESDLKNIFTDILEKLKQGQLVLFSGTPCQVAGIKSFLRKDFNNLFCVDFVCHGVPSPMVWENYVRYRASKDADDNLPQNINLRSKVTGWSKYQYSNVFEYDNGKRYSVKSSDSLFMKLFVGDYVSRISCSNCKFKGCNRVSDITIGDFWGIWDILPEMDDNKGTSVVLVHSEHGQALWDEIISRIKYKEVTIEQASRQNPSMLVSSQANAKRELVMERIKNGQIESCEELFAVKKESIFARIRRRVRDLL